MAHKIETVSSRVRLAARRAPYWHRIRKGVYVGFRKMTADSVGSWLARARLPDGRQSFDSLGSLEGHPANERFDVAVAAVLEWLKKLGPGVVAGEVKTVQDACALYVQHVRDTKGEAAAIDAEARYRRRVYPYPIATVALGDLTREMLKIFRRDLASTPVVAKSGTERERSKDSVNRDMTPLRAALNYAFAEGIVQSDFAWRETLKPFPNSGRRRELYLDRQQREALIGKAPPDLGRFLRALSAVPLRPGAVAALPVANFEERLSSLKVGKDKHGRDRKLPLGPRVAKFFSEACAGKKPDEPIFPRSDGRWWDKDAWKHPIKAAAAAAGLPPETTAYTLRHSIITDLVHSGLDLLTVAQISGTSVAMVEKHYGHLRGQRAADALELVAVGAG